MKNTTKENTNNEDASLEETTPKGSIHSFFLSLKSQIRVLLARIIPFFLRNFAKMSVFLLLFLIVVALFISGGKKEESDPIVVPDISTKEPIAVVEDSSYNKESLFTKDRPYSIKRPPIDHEPVEYIPRSWYVTPEQQYLIDNWKSIKIDGGTTLVPLHQALENRFGGGEYISHSKTVDAFEKFISGDVDILIGVDYSDELLQKAKSKGINLKKLEITREAFIFLINRNNPVHNLTINQIKGIYSGRITNWSEIGGDNALIMPYQRNTDSGSQMRMEKFMGYGNLMTADKEYTYGFMGGIVEAIAKYDSGKYSIGYNMYTFTEKQYPNEEVMLLDVNGITPNDENIINGSYPIIIYNYIFYDDNNKKVAEFADNLYSFLMSDSGQGLISYAGYINLNTMYDRNRHITLPYDSDEPEWSDNYITYYYYDAKKGEFYDVDDDKNLLVFDTYADYVLRDSKYSSNESIRGLLNLMERKEMYIYQFYTFFDKDNNSLIIQQPWHRGGAGHPPDYFAFRYNDRYYSTLIYDISNNKYYLSCDLPHDSSNWSQDSWLRFYISDDIVDNLAYGEKIEINLVDLYFRYFLEGEDYSVDSHQYQGKIELRYKKFIEF